MKTTRAELERLGCVRNDDWDYIDRNGMVVAWERWTALEWDSRVRTGKYRPRFRVKAIGVE